MTGSGSSANRRVPRRHLRRVPRLASLKSSDLDWVQQRFQRRRYGAGETILPPVRDGFLGIVETGDVVIISATPWGRRSIAALRAGDFFSTLMGHNQAPGATTVRAMTPATLWMLHQADVIQLEGRQGSASRWLAALPKPPGQKSRFIKLALGAIAILFMWAIWTSSQGQAFRADLRYAWGSWYLQRGQTEAAVREFQVALKTSPTHAASYNSLGYIYYQQGRLEEALAAFEQAADLTPDSDVIQNNLGLIRSHRGETQEALENLHQAADLGGNVSQVYVNLGDLYLDNGDWLNAGRAYREALRLNPERAVTHHNLGVAYYRLGRLADAYNEFDQALRLAPDLTTAHVGLGVVAFEQGRFGVAQAAFQRAVELDPQAVTAIFYLGLVHKRLGNPEQAAKAFERALGLTSDPVIHEQGAWHLKELWGEPKPAKKLEGGVEH